MTVRVSQMIVALPRGENGRFTRGEMIEGVQGVFSSAQHAWMFHGRI